jgi:HK97 family phage major capsid protein
MSVLIVEAEKRSAAALATVTALSALIETEARGFTADESTTVEAALTVIETEARNIANFRKLEDATAATEVRAADELARANEARAKVVAAAQAGGTQIEVRDADVYIPDNARTSFFKDLLLAKRSGDAAALDRLHRNNSVRADIQTRAGMTTVTGAGGEFAPPVWMEDQIVALARPGRPLANLFPSKTLPKGISQFDIPTVATGSQSAAQSAQNTGINIVNPTSSVIPVGINTLASGVLVSQQLLDQSGVPVDSYIIPDMAADYARQLDVSIVAALAGTAGINSVTYTDATPTSVKIIAQVQAAVDAVHTNRYAPAQVIVMHPSRWGKIKAATDSAGRPLVPPTNTTPAFNVPGSANGQIAQGTAGELAGLPVVLDASIPQNLGVGTNQDEIFILKADDIWLWEGVPTADVLLETYGAQLSVLYRYWNYYSFTALRYPKATAVITGTGLVTTLAYGS